VLSTLIAVYLEAEVFPARENCGEEPGMNKLPYFIAELQEKKKKKKTKNHLFQ